MTSRFLVIYLLFSLLNDAATAWDDEDFFTNCPPSRCSNSDDEPEIRFPFRLESSNTSCGAPGMHLSCSGQDTVLLHAVLGPCKVIRIDYESAYIFVIPLADSWSHCPLKKMISTNLSTNVYTPLFSQASLVGCSREFTPNSQAHIVGPVYCLGSASQLVYAVSSSEAMPFLPLDCKVVSQGIRLPYIPNQTEQYWRSSIKRTLAFGEISLFWQVTNISYICQDCELSGRPCGFNSESWRAFCKQHVSHVKVIAATSSVAAFIVFSLMVATALFLSLRTKHNEEIHLKVEMFLKTYGASKPTRYTFSEVKKITRRFKHKLGQGGFGSVYKGELQNGVPVAVKMLENSKGEGEEFINEVATIGRIHHANVVRLVGFCSEGTRRALFYEFMPNQSLEKYIFSHDSNASSQELLLPDRMLDVALGIARGMEYLHQGCNQRILHFDIKPHNILLDYNFNPKISDFGLAKLCARDRSIVTLTTARGTMGYIAPELYSRNFGVISYKSDVYSFGMLVLEMVSGRRNSDPRVDGQNEVYLPEWIYERIVFGDEFGLSRGMTHCEKEKVRKLAIVALWCIQWNPANRPSMPKVVNMLTGNSQNLQMPPKPFVSSLRHPMPQT